MRGSPNRDMGTILCSVFCIVMLAPAWTMRMWNRMPTALISDICFSDTPLILRLQTRERVSLRGRRIVALASNDSDSVTYATNTLYMLKLVVAHELLQLIVKLHQHLSFTRYMQRSRNYCL